MRRLVGLLVALALTLGVGSAVAQSGSLPVPVNISPVGPSAGGGLSTVATFDARGVGGAANAGYYSRPVLVSRNTLGGLANGLLRRAAPVAAMVALVEAAGWVIDELTGQVLSGPPVPTTVPPGGQYWKNTFNNNTYPSAYAAAAAYSPNGVSIHSCGVENASGIQQCQATVDHPAWGPPYTVTFGVNGIRNLGTEPFPLSHPGAQPAPVPQSDLGQLVEQNPNVWNDALRNPDGSVNRNPDVMAEAQALANELAAANPSPDPTSEWDTGNQGGDPQHSPTNIEFPNFCEWASVVCSAIDWLREPPEPSQDVDMPEVDLPGPSGWVSSLGQGSCPAPHIINLNLGTQVYEWDPWCDLAARIKPLVIASAAFAALLILAGVSRRGDGNA